MSKKNDKSLDIFIELFIHTLGPKFVFLVLQLLLLQIETSIMVLKV